MSKIVFARNFVQILDHIHSFHGGGVEAYVNLEGVLTEVRRIQGDFNFRTSLNPQVRFK